MSSTLKHAFRSLAWYASQDAEAWKMLSFLTSVVLVAIGVASYSGVPLAQ